MRDGVRGEVTIKLGESEFVLVPTYRAFAEIERRTGLGCFEVAQKIEAGSMSVAVEILSSAAPKVPADEIFGELMEHGGVMAVAPDLYRFVLLAFTGHQRMTDESNTGEAPEADRTKSA